MPYPQQTTYTHYGSRIVDQLRKTTLRNKRLAKAVEIQRDEIQKLLGYINTLTETRNV